MHGFQYRKGGPWLPYLFHSHNCGVKGSARRTERTVELPIAEHWLGAVATARAPEKPILAEIGAVTPYYWNRIPVVVDPGDRRATHNMSLFKTDLRGYDVLSISTLEHIGENRYGFREPMTSLDGFLKLQDEAERFLVTVPYGWESKQFQSLQSHLLCSEAKEYLNGQGIRVWTITRREDEQWVPSDSLRPYGKPPKPWANTLIIAEKGGLL